jgi:hypothetical protein
LLLICSDVLESPSEMVKSDIEQTTVNEAQLRADPNLQILPDEGAQNVSDPSSESVSQYESTLPNDLQANPSDIQNFQVCIFLLPLLLTAFLR